MNRAGGTASGSMDPAGTTLGFSLHEQTNSIFCLNLFELDFGPLLPRIVTHTKKKKNVFLTLTDITHFPCAPGSEMGGSHRYLLTPPPPPPP